MSGRIEEIKSRCELLFENDSYFTRGEVEYLLSKLEIAEKALEEVLTECGHDHIEPSNRLQEIEYIVQDALQQLRS